MHENHFTFCIQPCNDIKMVCQRHHPLVRASRIWERAANCPKSHDWQVAGTLDGTAVAAHLRRICPQMNCEFLKLLRINLEIENNLVRHRKKKKRLPGEWLLPFGMILFFSRRLHQQLEWSRLWIRQLKFIQSAQWREIPRETSPVKIHTEWMIAVTYHTCDHIHLSNGLGCAYRNHRLGLATIVIDAKRRA